MALMQLTVIPVGTARPGVGDFIADIEGYLQSRGIEHSLHDMGTVVCGEVDFLLELARDLHAFPFKRGVQRVITQITLDERRDTDRKLGDKCRAVLNRLPENQSHEE